ncbi:MAG: hypothetical protein L0216_06420 [Planctomycetales bacterium]|nr:hypothetical protein [Planctomycetales bacterium]
MRAALWTAVAAAALASGPACSPGPVRHDRPHTHETTGHTTWSLVVSGAT